LDRLQMTTRSEAIQRVLGKDSCPYLLSCDVEITKNFFSRICNSSNYVNCQHFARRVGELNNPMTWVQKMAVEEFRQEPLLNEPVSFNIDLRS
jgi:hypothetical protein